eukprot:scaffold1983_cov376-Prasinococcus_capsulatus_cf.AAC.16
MMQRCTILDVAYKPRESCATVLCPTASRAVLQRTAPRVGERGAATPHRYELLATLATSARWCCAYIDRSNVSPAVVVQSEGAHCTSPRKRPISIIIIMLFR